MNCCNGNCRQGRDCPNGPIPIPLTLRILCVLAFIYVLLVSSGALDALFPRI